jgi:L-seryl-tRNA(Ser) seleniumtransferase
MEDASKSFVHIPELQSWAGRAIAKATGSEAGIPTSGSSNAITLAAAACIMKGTELENYDPIEQETWTHIIQRLPMQTEGLKTEFIVQKCNRNIYDHAVECAGGKFIEVGTEKGTDEQNLEEAFDPEKTAAYYITDKSSDNRLFLSDVARVAHDLDVPVIIDAASELPPRSNLKRYTKKGADLVIVSGGKFISGPNNSGLLAGRKDLIKLAHLNAYPFHGVGRGAKMSRETIVALNKALEIYLELNENSLVKDWELKAMWIADQLKNLTNVKVKVTWQTTTEHKEPQWPLCIIEIEKDITGKNAEEISNILRKGSPSIEARATGNKLIINPEFLLEGDQLILTQRITDLLK